MGLKHATLHAILSQIVPEMQHLRGLRHATLLAILSPMIK